MRLVIHEWCCSGGFAGHDRWHVVGNGDDVEPLAREGRVMFRGLLADAVRDGGFEVTALVDEACRIDVPAGVRVRSVAAGDEIEVLIDESRRADATLIVAPETAGILANRVTAVRAAGGEVLAPSNGFIEIASDKQATIDTLAAAGVPVPAGRPLTAGESWPRWFHLPAVRKARGSTGCDDLVVVRHGDVPPPPAVEPARLEAFVEGLAVGVSCLVGAAGILPLPAVRQRFSSGPRPRYLGGEPLVEPAVARRAERLAARAVAAVARAGGGTQAGWVGVDMILGDRADGLDDRVLEVNPRLTTSFVGFGSGGDASLVRAIVDVAMCRGAVVPDVSPAAFSLTEDASA
ncbi:MAG: ATP-grasp domain-containing protein [Planctomycetia bacterium]|nr:ATP-grasp domain-containing protein [Planctomycetia bacterium]